MSVRWMTVSDAASRTADALQSCHSWKSLASSPCSLRNRAYTLLLVWLRLPPARLHVHCTYAGKITAYRPNHARGRLRHEPQGLIER